MDNMDLGAAYLHVMRMDEVGGKCGCVVNLASYIMPPEI